jgi:hypothetical protein
MSASREFFNLSDDFIVIRADINDSPSVEIPLTELFDLATFTLVDNYQQVLHGYVIELLEDTIWVDEQSFLHLLRGGYGICRETQTGLFRPMKRSDLQGFILQNLRDCNANDLYFAVPLLIKFSVSNADLPRSHRRVKEPPRITRSSASRFVSNVLSNEESSIANNVPYAANDTNGDNASITSTTIRDCVDSTRNDVYCCEAPRMVTSVSASCKGSGTGPFFGHDGKGKSNDINNDDLVDVCIIVEKGRNGHTAVCRTVITACGMTAEGYGIHRVTNTNSEDAEMPSKRDTEQHHDTLNVDDFTSVYIAAAEKAGDAIIAFPMTAANSMDNLPHASPSTPAGPSPRRLSLPSVLMRYHPIDRGRRYFVPI